jgi:glycosyltransferase involved in cell wall biosynthesis
VVSPPGRHFARSGRFGRLYGFGLWLARQDFSAYEIVHALGDNYLLGSRVPVVRTVSGAALAEALHARKLTTRLMQLSTYALELIGVIRASAAVGISRDSNRYFPWLREVIPQGIDTTLFSGGIERTGPPSILFVGHRLHDRKRAYALLDAFRETVRPVLRDSELWLVMDDAVEAPGVHCYANLPIEELALLYRRAWVFCLPSSYEGFGRPYAEALASGTPVVTTPNAGALEVLENGRYGVVTPLQGLGASLTMLLKDQSRREALARDGLRRAAAFDWARVTADYEALYRRVLVRRQARNPLPREAA